MNSMEKVGNSKIQKFQTLSSLDLGIDGYTREKTKKQLANIHPGNFLSDEENELWIALLYRSVLS